MVLTEPVKSGVEVVKLIRGRDGVEPVSVKSDVEVVKLVGECGVVVANCSLLPVLSIGLKPLPNF